MIKQIKHKNPKKEHCYWANLNKNCDHETYLKEVLKGDYNKEVVFVYETIYVDKITFRGLQQSYLDNVSEYFTQGGHTIDEKEAIKDNPELLKECLKDIPFWELSKEAQDFYRKYSIRMTTKIVCEELINHNDGNGIFYIDNQGYTYARYVGVSESEFNYCMFYKIKQEEKFKLDTKIEKIAEKYNFNRDNPHYEKERDIEWNHYEDKIMIIKERYNQDKASIF